MGKKKEKEEVFQYKSQRKYFSLGQLDSYSANGLKCVLSSSALVNSTSLMVWTFVWDAWKQPGIHVLTGCIKVTVDNQPTTINVDVGEGFSTVEHSCRVVCNSMRGMSIQQSAIEYEYDLVACRFPSIETEEMFSSSDITDAILEVEEKHLHVNKTFLSIHSDFFRALFSEKYKEGGMNAIPIKDVTYLDFCLLLSTVYPETVFPNDHTVPKLLELADRFLLRSVTRHVEYHLMNNSKINNQAMLLLADQYEMDKLLEKVIKNIDTMDEAKKLKSGKEFKSLSKKAKVMLCNRLVDII